MSDNARDFGLFIDGLRLDRNMSRENLIDGIVSLSQYKRYLRGAASIPNSILIQLADRLKLSLSGLHQVFESFQDNQLKKISHIYLLIQHSKFDIAYKEAIELRDAIFISDYNKIYFDYCLIFVQYKLNMVSPIHTLEKFSILVDYPNCIKNETYNWIEINILMGIVRISSTIENYIPSIHMYEIVTSPTFKFITAGDSQFLPSILSTLAPILGKQEKFEEVITIAKDGIEYCKKYQTSAALASLYLSKAYALRDLERLSEAKECGKKALMQLYIEGNLDKFNSYKRLLENRLELTDKDLTFI